MSNKDSNKKNIRKKGTRKLRRQKRFLVVLVGLASTVGILQLQSMMKEAKVEEGTLYSSLVFDQPLKQTLEVAQIEKQKGHTLFNNQNKVIEFSDIKNYHEDNLDRYIAYQTEFPDLLTAEVVWRVNVDLDYADYSNVSIIENPDYYTSVVNKNKRIDENYVPQDLVEVEGTEFMLRYQVNESLKQMIEELKKAELDLSIKMAYLSNDEVEALIDVDSEVDENDYALIKVGHDEHQLGLAVDVDNIDELPFEESALALWLTNNAHRFGFVFRYANDESVTHYAKQSNHLRYVGEDVAIDMYEKNIKHLEEYLDKHEN